MLSSKARWFADRQARVGLIKMLRRRTRYSPRISPCVVGRSPAIMAAARRCPKFPKEKIDASSATDGDRRRVLWRCARPGASRQDGFVGEKHDCRQRRRKTRDPEVAQLRHPGGVAGDGEELH